MKKHVFASAVLGAALAFGAILPVLAEGEVPSAGATGASTTTAGITAANVPTTDAAYTTFHSKDINTSTASYGTSVTAAATKMGVSSDRWNVAAVAMFDLTGDAASVNGAVINGVAGINKGDHVCVLHITGDTTSELLSAEATGTNQIKITQTPSTLSPFVVLKATAVSTNTTGKTTTSTSTSTTSTTTQSGYNVPNTADRG